MDHCNQIAFPTPYSDVNTVLLDLKASIQQILGVQFVGQYLYGSLALGDFDPQTSDIDFIVVTQSEIPSELFDTLRSMHAEFDRSSSPWARKVEVAYVPLAVLKHTGSAAAPYPQIEKGTELFRVPPEVGWTFQRYILRERGVVVSGPHPATFTGPVEHAEMQEAAAVILRGWQEQARMDPEWIAWVRERGAQSFVVLTICRLLYSLDTGSAATKPGAARWAQQTLGASRAPLIQRALASQHDRDEISDVELTETLDFLDEALKQAQKR